MIAIIKTQTESLNVFFRTELIDYRYLGVNQMGDHYHEINFRPKKALVDRLTTSTRIIDFAFDVPGNKYYRALWEESTLAHINKEDERVRL